MKNIFVVCLLLFPCLAVAQSSKKSQIEHGRYLVTRIAMCADCHTPRDQQGNSIKSQWLKGSVLPFKPLAPMPWAAAAPAIAGLPRWTDEEAVTFFTTGKMKGQPPLPPMPEYHMTASDARAVVAYLRSLGASPAKPKSALSGGGKR